MQTSYRLPNPLPPLPVRKGVRGRRPKSQTIALLKAAAEAAAAAAANGAPDGPARTGPGPQLAPRPHKKRGPKPGSKRKPRVVQPSASPTTMASTPESRLSSSHASVESNHSNGPNVVCTVCVYVNKHGDYGPHLDRKLVQQLPDHFGPAPVNAVLQQSVQACVDCTYQPSVLLPFLQSQAHTGGEVIRVRSEHGIRYVKLPSASSTSSVLRFLETMCQHLQSDSLFSSQPFSPVGHTHLYSRTKTEPPSHTENGLSSEDSKKDSVPSTRSLRTTTTTTTTEYRASLTERPFYAGHNNRAPPALRGGNANPAELGQIRTHRRVEASSTTGPDHATQDKDAVGPSASSWSVDDVIRFVQEADPQTLGPHVELFRKHEIDGRALMLLRSDVIMKYMGLKLGPALKLCHHIEKLKQTKA